MIRDNYPTFPRMSGKRRELTDLNSVHSRQSWEEGASGYLGIRLPWESHIHLVIKSMSHWKEGAGSRFDTGAPSHKPAKISVTAGAFCQLDRLEPPNGCPYGHAHCGRHHSLAGILDCARGGRR